jgi:predicted RNase H-like HicB family nuclease
VVIEIGQDEAAKILKRHGWIDTVREFAVYPAIFEHGEDGITITFPDLPGAISCAGTEEEALFMARDALGAWVVANEDIGNAIPEPSQVAGVTCASGQSICLVEAWLPIFREEQRAGSVKKNVTVPIWLNALAEKAGLNFSQILQAGLKHTLGIK